MIMCPLRTLCCWEDKVQSPELGSQGLAFPVLSPLSFSWTFQSPQTLLYSQPLGSVPLWVWLPYCLRNTGGTLTPTSSPDQPVLILHYSAWVLPFPEVLFTPSLTLHWIRVPACACIKLLSVSLLGMWQGKNLNCCASMGPMNSSVFGTW